MPNPDQDYVVQMANLRVRVEHQYVAERQDELTIRLAILRVFPSSKNIHETIIFL